MAGLQFIILSADDSGIPIAQKLIQEGRSVYYALAPEKKSEKNGEAIKSPYDLGDSIVDRIDFNRSIDDLILNADKYKDEVVIIFDRNHSPEIADKLRDTGYLVVGGGQFTAKLEKDRKFGLDVMKQAGIQIPESQEFKPNEFAKAISFLESQPENESWVFKPDKGESWITFPADNKDELIRFIKCVETKHIETGDFVLQKKIKGIECSCEGWFNGDEFVMFNATLERKRRSTGDTGRNTGCAGDVVFGLTGDERIVKEGIGKIEPLLKKNGIPLMIDLNQILTPDGLYAIEWTPRFGYNASMTLWQLFENPLSEILFDLAGGTLIGVPLKDGFGISVRMLRDKIISDIPVSINPSIIDNCWFWDVIKKGREYICAGVCEDLLFITDYGKTIPEAKKNVYDKMKKIIIPDMDYRIDIGVKALEDYNTLKAEGWI